MKRILLFAWSALMMFLASCMISDPSCKTVYVYTNTTANNIEISNLSFDDEYAGSQWAPASSSSFTVPAHGEHIVSLGELGDFCIVPSAFNKGEWVTVSNGIKQITVKSGSIMDIANYELVEQKKYYWKYKYVFTDADFENGEPIDNDKQ